ncbi:Deoxycytidylate deaminase [Flavobacterium flevense]|uniref:Cytidine deaminase n=1 Tax=Flavobacterium flevense TaxID=983 RepID=A0A4Y4AUC8_9FLAO|nr:anti-phage dCTP deaminase [Flavobacterium flevense]GEC71811.1 cytidine deaminase [Flavobacterium flevense]SHL37353.1 Deoxycytidylate deaminase [Flavobacterium flevense]
MGELAIKSPTLFKSENSKSTLEKFEKTLTEELIIGICSPIGSLKEKVLENLKYKIETDYQYEEVKILKLSEFIEEYEFTEEEKNEIPKVRTNASAIFSEYYNKINKGNIIRKHNNNERLAEYAVKKIHVDRVAKTKEQKGLKDQNPKSTDYESRRVCYIIDSIKTKEELYLLRKIYSENFYLISVFSSLEDRKANLKTKNFKNTEIEEIIEIDDRQNYKYGQNVRDVFVEGDLFIRVSKGNIPKIDHKISRFLHLVFETSIITPTIEEIAMYNAKAAAGNSACLSRQVGACIVDDKENVLSIGWNDVPKYGGNLYTSNTENDQRCFNHEFCSNDFQKSKVVDNIVESILNDEEFEELKKSSNIEFRLKEKIIKNTKVKDLIEFSRSVHAEMHAIIQGALTTGDKLIGSRLFCTTYPCHNCARHIIAAGIKEVYYIEPYVKSLCLTLHEDAMSEKEDSNNKVKILIFDGVSPNRYLSFFTNFAERKNNGKLVKKDLKTAKPKSSKSLQALSTLEEQAVITLES